jgi:hypothetical protein
MFDVRRLHALQTELLDQPGDVNETGSHIGGQRLKLSINASIQSFTQLGGESAPPLTVNTKLIQTLLLPRLPCASCGSNQIWQIRQIRPKLLTGCLTQTYN